MRSFSSTLFPLSVFSLFLPFLWSAALPSALCCLFLLISQLFPSLLSLQFLSNKTNKLLRHRERSQHRPYPRVSAEEKKSADERKREREEGGFLLVSWSATEVFSVKILLLVSHRSSRPFRSLGRLFSLWSPFCRQESQTKKDEAAERVARKGEREEGERKKERRRERLLLLSVQVWLLSCLPGTRVFFSSFFPFHFLCLALSSRPTASFLLLFISSSSSSPS